MNGLPLPFEKQRGEVAVFISHFHLDHTAGLRWLHPDVPIYTSEESAKVWIALARSGLAEEGTPYEHTKVVPMPEGTPFSIGDIRFWTCAVDHNIPGASALFLETPDMRIVYSGDLRLHGANPQRTARFVAEAHRFRPDLLLLEGTSLPREEETEALRRPPLYESALAKRLATEAQDVQGPLLLHTYVRDAERLLSYVELAEKLGRKAVLGPKAARYLYALTGNKNFGVLQQPQDDFQEPEGDQTSAPGILPLQHDFLRISTADLAASPKAFLVHIPCTYPSLALDLSGIGGLFLHSDGMPYGPHSPAYRPWREAIEKNGYRYAVFHTSGHAVPEHLFQIVRAINPKYLVPVHTFNPERYKEIFPRTVLPEPCVPYGPKDFGR